MIEFVGAGLARLMQIAPGWAKICCMIDCFVLMTSPLLMLIDGGGLWFVAMICAAMGLCFFIAGAKLQKNQANRWTVPADYFLPLAACPKCGLEDSHLLRPGPSSSAFDVIRTCSGCKHAWGQRVGSVKLVSAA